MKGKIYFFIQILIGIFIIFPIALNAQAPDGGPPIREIPVPGLPQGGLASMDNFGPVIYINPQLMNLGGAIFHFLRAHEYGHHRQGHINPRNVQRMMTDPYYKAWITKPMELEADCYGARTLMSNGGPNAVEYVARYFEASQGPFSGAAYYPSGFERADHIRRCAGF